MASPVLQCALPIHPKGVQCGLKVSCRATLQVKDQRFTERVATLIIYEVAEVTVSLRRHCGLTDTTTCQRVIRNN